MKKNKDDNLESHMRDMRDAFWGLQKKLFEETSENLRKLEETQCMMSLGKRVYM